MRSWVLKVLNGAIHYILMIKTYLKYELFRIKTSQNILMLSNVNKNCDENLIL